MAPKPLPISSRKLGGLDCLTNLTGLVVLFYLFFIPNRITESLLKKKQIVSKDCIQKKIIRFLSLSLSLSLSLLLCEPLHAHPLRSPSLSILSLLLHDRSTHALAEPSVVEAQPPGSFSKVSAYTTK